MKSIVISMATAVSLLAASSVFAADVPAVAEKFHCTTCHSVTEKKIGPSWTDISKFYNGKMEKSPTGKTLGQVTAGESSEVYLLSKVSKGGYGVWGTQPMLANDDVYHQVSSAKQADLKELVKFVLGLAK